jgi:Tat protein translocase TatC
MDFLREFHLFVKNIIYWIYSFLGLSFIFLFFGLKEVTLFGKNLLLPMLADNSFSVQIFNLIRQDILPPNVQLIATNPMSAFTAQLFLSFFFGFIFTIPFFLYKVIMYLRPALLPREIKAVFWSILFLAGLFLLGVGFSYVFIVPATFKLLYPFAIKMGALPFFSIEEFIQYTLGLTMVVGTMFLMPLLMILLSYIHIIKAEFWKARWRFMVLFFLALSAIITPDGTGITMLLLFVPLSGLYFAGYYFANRFEKSV